MPNFDVTVIMHFEVEDDTFDKARTSAINYVLSRLSETYVGNSADTSNSVQNVGVTGSDAHNRRQHKKPKRKKSLSQEEAQNRYNDRVRRVACPLCKAKPNEYCWNMRSLAHGLRVHISTAHGERQIAHREAYPAIHFGHPTENDHSD